jgi:hypothetical protein
LVPEKRHGAFAIEGDFDFLIRDEGESRKGEFTQLFSNIVESSRELTICG